MTRVEERREAFPGDSKERCKAFRETPRRGPLCGPRRLNNLTSEFIEKD
jgi:hypothetical protein